MSSQHGGNISELADSAGLDEDDILDFSANINPLGPPEWLRPTISRTVEKVRHYPDPDSTQLVDAIAAHHDIPGENIVVGNGTSQLIFTLCRAAGCSRAIIPVPCYVDYARAADTAGMEVTEIALREDDQFRVETDRIQQHLHGDEMVFLGQPNNPTGRSIPPESILDLARNHPDTLFAIDEAFIDFAGELSSIIPHRPDNVVVLRSMTKFYAVPGLRLGYLVASTALAGDIRDLIPPWSLNVFALAVGQRALEADETDEYSRTTRETVDEQRKHLRERLAELDVFTVYPAEANFLLLRIDNSDWSAPRLAKRLLHDYGIAIRVCDNFGGLDERFVRIAVRNRPENERLLNAFADIFSRDVPGPRSSRTPAVMFQGTSSSAGKSVMTAALCRILLQDGLRVAPFKAQNMSLNSFVTPDGCEMGRAQAMQAQACRVETDVRMNPVLLKPNSDTGCQVIVNGHPVGNMGVKEYVDYKPTAFEEVKQAYGALSENYDALVLEGAGSPAEINLKHHDIVNMRMAHHAQAPVLLVGDIDRGGVFASFVGCMEVMAEWERELVGGFVVNKFRGDESLLGPAFDYVQGHTGRPVLGTIPYLKDLGLPEEDSVQFKSGRMDETQNDDAAVEVALVDLPHISNFTDMDALRMEPDVSVKIIRPGDDVGHPDALIIPGSKNVIGDLRSLRDSGLDDAITRLAHDGETEIIGLCGGFQMLGRMIADPHQIESSAGSIDGLGLLPVTTTMAETKTLQRVKGLHLPSGHEIHGYEIHHGNTETEKSVPIARSNDNRMLGAAAPDAPVWGTYMHGIFDADEFRRWFINRLRERRGLQTINEQRTTYDLDPAFNRLAEITRAKLDTDRIFEMMGL